MAAPFERAFAQQAALEKAAEDPANQPPAQGAEIMSINYRDDEAIYIVPGQDRVTVVFSTTFKEETDKIFGRVFLQEFVDARRQPSIQNAPQVLYSHREPPLEVRSIPGLSRGDDVGYVTFGEFGKAICVVQWEASSSNTCPLSSIMANLHAAVSSVPSTLPKPRGDGGDDLSHPAVP